MICPACSRLRDGEEPGDTCPECGTALVPTTESHVEALVQAALKRHLERWRSEGLLDGATLARLQASLKAAPAEQPSAAPAGKPADTASRLEAWANEVVASLRQAAEWRPGWGAALARSLEETAKAEREQEARRRSGEDSTEDGLGSALESGNALFGRAGSSALGGGLESVVALDEGRAESTPKLHEYIWWFLGAVLVLGGSLMGVREAWRALGGVPRQLLVTGALFGYHAGFIGLGAFLARRSLTAGRILAIIGVALLPVVFVALSALVALSPLVGVPVALAVAGVGLLPLRMAGRLMQGASASSLALALYPSLLASLPLMGLEDAPWPRALCAFAGVAALGVSVWRAGSGKASLAGVGAALYGALGLAVFCVASAPLGFEALEAGGALFAGMTLWAVALAAVVAWTAGSPGVRDAYPRAGPVLETLAHAVLASGALAGALGAFSVMPGEDTWVDGASVAAPTLVTGLFYLLEPRRRALAHPAVMAAMLTGLLVARTLVPGNPAWWLFGATVVAAGLLPLARSTPDGGLRLRLLTWGVVGSVVAMPAFALLYVGWGPFDVWPRAMAGLAIAAAAHAAGGWQWRGLHYLGGAAVLFGAFAALEAFPLLGGFGSNLSVLVVAGGLYGLAALAQRTDDLRPLDDLSLGMLSLAVLGSTSITPSLPLALESLSGTAALVVASLPTVLASVLLLLLRVRRDRSLLVSCLAAFGLTLWVSQLAGTISDFTTAWAALVSSALVLGFTAFAALRGAPVAVPAEARAQGRRVLGAIYLPLPTRGLPLFTEGFAAVALLQALGTVMTLLQWRSMPVDADRGMALLAGGVLTGAALLAFVSRAFVAWFMRGSVGTLAVLGGFIALTAVVNRAGRPLPPEVSAWRLPLIGLALWGVALATRRFGPALGNLLKAPSQGPLYHFVPHAGVGALGLVLLSSAFRVGAPDVDLDHALGVVPPLLLLGAALLTLLLAASFRSVLVASLGLLLGLPGAALWAARQSLLGPGLAALLPPDGQWVHATAVDLGLDWLQPEAWLASGDSVFQLYQRAFAGIAAAGLAYAGAVLGTQHEPLRKALRQWSLVAVALVGLAAFFMPGLTAAGLVFATGGVLFLKARTQGRVVLGAGFLLLVHAAAHRVPVFESWPGPVLALAGLAAVSLSPWVAKWRGLSEASTRVRAHLAAALFLSAALAYALASGGETSPWMAVPNLLWEMLLGFSGQWVVSAAFPVTLALTATALLVAAFQWKGSLAGFLAGAGAVLAGSVGVTGLSAYFVSLSLRAASLEAGAARIEQARLFSEGLTVYGQLSSASGVWLALAAALGALALHAGQQVTRGGRSDVSGGLGFGRDAWLVTCGGFLTIAATSGPPSEALLPYALAALGLAVGVSLHAAWREHTGRHVYFVQVAVVGVYALVRSLYAQGLRPEHDALFALALGFALVGVTVLARRAGVPPVAEATRRFAALLPLGMAFVLPGEATREAALLAGGSGMMYAALGAVERSRLFGTFAAAAGNLALLLAALAFGLEGLEIYLAPLGLLLLMLGQLFTHSLPHAARNAVRILGGLFLYVPAAAKLAVGVGTSTDGMYALVFGGVCLLGVAAGMALQIRAYLALGTLFLTLDVVANLLDAGLRDHRVGFLVMTLTGLTIVGGRVLATVKRQEWELLMGRVRTQLRGWD